MTNHLWPRQQSGINVDFLGALETMDTAHHRIHQGVMFATGASDVALVDLASLDILLQVPAGTFLHIRGDIASGGDSEVQFYEGTTFSVAGSALSVINRNRITSIVSTATLTTGPTITDPGTLLLSDLFVGGQKNSAIGSSAQFDEWILHDDVYLMRLFNQAGSAQRASMTLTWYEPNLLP